MTINNERGFSLVEMLVSLAIIAFLMPVIVMSFAQLTRVSAASNNHMLVVRQAQDAGFWISKDLEQADPISIHLGTAVSGFFPLDLTWSTGTYAGGIFSEVHQVRYSLSLNEDTGRYEITRRDTKNSDAPVMMTVADYIDAGFLDLDADGAPDDLNGDGVADLNTRIEAISSGGGPILGYRLFITSTITGSGGTGSSETRVYEFKPRPDTA